jgi:hypothetical protein
MKNRITFICLGLLLAGTLLAQEPAAPVVASPDTAIQEPTAIDQVEPEQMLLDSLMTEPVGSDTTQPELIQPEQLTPEAAQPEATSPAPVQRPPVAPGLVPPQPVLPLIEPKTAQMKPAETTNYAQMIYWKSLTKDEKKVFLYAYLFRTYEMLEQVKGLPEMKSAMKPFKKKITDPVFDLFRNLDEKQKDDIVFWIDIFYRNDLNKDQPFSAALHYASEKIKTGYKSMQDIYRDNYK